MLDTGTSLPFRKLQSGPGIKWGEQRHRVGGWGGGEGPSSVAKIVDLGISIQSALHFPTAGSSAPYKILTALLKDLRKRVMIKLSQS